MEITRSAVSLADWRAIIEKATEQAKRGEPTARKFLADYIIGPPTQHTEIDAGPLTFRVVYEDQ